MTDQEFAEEFFKKALEKGHRLTSQENIPCPHGKNLSKDKLKTIHSICGEKCAEATAEQLKQAGIASCCAELFRIICKLIYPSPPSSVQPCDS